MLSINWFRLIFIIKLIVMTLVTIEGAPIDIIHPPTVTSSPNDTQIPIITIASFVTDNPSQQAEDNHVESQTRNDLITNVANLKGDQVVLNTYQQEVSTQTGNTAKISIHSFVAQQTYQSTNPLTHMEAREEKAKEIENSENKNKNFQNTTEGSVPQNENSSEETSIQSTIESETNNSQTTKENTQNTTEGNLLGNQHFIREATKQVNLNNNEKPVIVLESENKISQTKIENPQNTTEENLPENPNLTEETTNQVNFNNTETPVDALHSEIINSQIAKENAQNSSEANLLKNPKLTQETTKQENFNNNENSVSALESENKNSQTTIENPQKISEGNLVGNQNLTREATKQVNLNNNEKLVIALDSKNIISQTKIENPQNTAEKNLPENSNLTEETTTNQVNFNNNENPVVALDSEIINSQTTTENPQNTTEENLQINQNLTQETTKQVNFNNIEIPLIALESEIINSQTTIENPQSSTEKKLIANQNLTQDTTKQENFNINEKSQIALEREKINSQSDSENFQNATEEILPQNQNSTKETSTQVNFNIDEKPVIALESENINSQKESENFQNATEEILPQNRNSTKETLSQVNFDMNESPLIALESKTINTQNDNENFQNTPEKNLLEKQISTKETSSQLNIDVNQTPVTALESNKSQNENENVQNTTEKELLENQTSTTETSPQIYLDINESPVIALKSEIVNSQIINENIQNTTVENLTEEISKQLLIVNSQNKDENLLKVAHNILTENKNLTKEISKHVNFSNPENTQNVIESDNFNFEKGNIQNTAQKNTTENQSSPEETSTHFSSTEKSQIPLESVIFSFQNVNENFQNTEIEVLTGNSELNKATVKQSDLSHVNHESDINLNFFTQNNNLQKKTDQIEESVKNIVKESEENLGNRENNELRNSQYLNENFQYSEQIEKAENVSINEENVTAKRMQEQQYNSENILINSLNLPENTQNSNVRFLIEQTQVKPEMEEEQILTDQKFSKFTESLPTTENIRFLMDPTDLSIELKQEQNLAEPQISETTNVPLTTTDNTQNILDIVGGVESYTKQGVVKDTDIEIYDSGDLSTSVRSLQNLIVNDTWNLGTVDKNSDNSSEYLQNVQISSSTQKNIENTTNSYLRTLEQMLNVDKSNSQITKENPQNIQLNIMATNSAVDEHYTTKTSLYDNEQQLPKPEVEKIASHLMFPNTQNGQLNSLVESLPAVAQSVDELTTENINLQSSPELNDNMMTQLQSDNPQNPFNDTKLENVIATEQKLETEKQTEEKFPSIYELSTILPNVEQNLSNLLENQSYMKQESSTMSSAEETTEKIANTNTQQNIDVNSNASLETPGFLKLTENSDVTMTNFQPSNFNTQDDLKISSSFKGKESSTESDRSKTGTVLNWNTEKSVEEITSKGGVAATDSIFNYSIEAETTTPKEIPLEPKAVEETTVSEISNIPLATEDTMEVNLEKAFKSFVESKESVESVEATTMFKILDTSTSAPAAETTTPFATTEAAAEEPTLTTNRDRNSYIRSTTNSQFASLLEETEMNVHKAFETLREWIASGNKREEATKNPAQMEEVSTTTKTEDESTKLPEPTVYTINTESVETATTKDKSESGSTLYTSTSPDNEESFTTFTMITEEVGNSTLSPVVDSILSSEVEKFNSTTQKLEKLQVKEHLQISHDESTIIPDLGEGPTPNSGNENLSDVPETATQSDTEAVTTEPSFTRVKLQKDLTDINLTYLDNSSEEVVSENQVKPEHSIEKKSEVAQISETQNEKDVNHNRNLMNVKFFNKENTILYQPKPVTFYQEMVKFIERETTETPKRETQTQVPLTQASFMEEQQQHIESTTESAVRSEYTTLEGPNDITTLGEMDVNNSNTTTEELLTTIELRTTNKALSTTELRSTITELPTTTNFPATTGLHTTPELPETTGLTTTTEFEPTTHHILETTITTEEDTTSTTDDPELVTTTLIVPGEPEGRSLDLPPPKLEYLQNEDGVEVFYGYSIVKHN